MATSMQQKGENMKESAEVDDGNEEDTGKEEEERLGDAKEMLTAILASQKDMSGNIQSLITTVTDVQKDVEMLKPLLATVDELTGKYVDMEKRLTAVENNTNKNEILDKVKAMLSKKNNDMKDAERRKELLQMIVEKRRMP